ncbi:FYDLN acid domain-containing protein [Acetobacter sicerae]|uniref:FYDLN acid domain-containing protein n=1 Tax=Acetobacter sicerae TaxID=85325 RepID=A0ABS8VSE0_9PROT|nr:FYDLN acid domain-containing protein [Acetobacter sicerae]MCE0742636.1 FYDLN acid domain-containing protein [Acetobacter sicerae]NHN90843.1 TIGR02300 family protein [Acetobacter sicerae]
MAQPELGSKRVCVSCGARFYDLTKDPAVCPKCGAEQPAEVPRLKRTGEIVPATPVKAPKPKTDEDDVDDDLDIVADDDDDDDDVIEDTSDLDDDADDISSDIDVPSEKDEHDS